MGLFPAADEPPSTRKTLPLLTLVLGGARSGKSRHAERLVEADGAAPIYIATAEALDDEMRLRIRHHRERRGVRWETVEAPLELAEAVARNAGPGRAVLVDCLTLWLSNLMLAGRDPAIAVGRLVEALVAAGGPVVLVANEVGLGIVPETPLGRAFRDEAGRLNQRVAALAQRVVFLVAGLPMTVKETA